MNRLIITACINIAKMLADLSCCIHTVSKGLHWLSNKALDVAKRRIMEEE